MMRKFPKLLAVVLAIAIIICPAMCLTSMAEESTPANDYSVAYENNVVTVTVSANEGFLVALLRLDVTGFSVDEEAITVAATPLGLDDPGTVVANPDFNAETGVLSLLIASNEAANTALMADATVSIPVTKTATDDNYRISLTTLQAADAGTIDEETGVVTAPEALLTFTNVNTETGEIDVEAAAGKNVAVAPCAHSNTTPDSKEATCTEAGYNRVTCNDCGEVITDEVIEPTGHDFEYEDLGDGTHMRVCANCAEDATEAHIDDDADLLCDSCNASLETPHECTAVTYSDNGDGTHDGICDCDAATVVVDNEAHADTDSDNSCDFCNASLEVEHTHEYLSYEYIDASTHRVYCECDDEQVVAHAYDEDGICACGANKPKESSKGFTYGAITYDAVTNILTIRRSAPDASVGEANTAAKNAGNRWRGIKVMVGDSEYKFDLVYTTGVGTFTVAGLAFTDMEQQIEVSYMITGDGFSYETDSVKVNVLELLQGVKGRDEKVAQLLDLYEASKTADIITMEAKALSEVKGFEYTSVNYNAATCTLTIGRSAPDASVGEANTAAKNAGNRWRGIKVMVGATEYKFDLVYTTGVGTFTVAGLALTDITEDITVSYMITGDGFSYESGSITVNVAAAIAASTGEFADLYNAFVA